GAYPFMYYVTSPAHIYHLSLHDALPIFYSSLKQTGPIIIVGSLEESEILQNLYQQGKLPQAKELEDVTEGYLITTVQDISPTIPYRKSTRLNSSHVSISYAVFCVQKKDT